jgi:hypothetical protein
MATMSAKLTTRRRFIAARRIFLSYLLRRDIEERIASEVLKFEP